MRYTIKESQLRDIIAESVNSALLEAQDRYEHTKMEWLKGKLDDLRHQMAVAFGNELSDDQYFALLGTLSQQYRAFKDPDIGDQMDALRAKHDKGFDRRNYGIYR